MKIDKQHGLHLAYLTLLALLTVEVILLVIQNRELKTTLRSMTVLAQVEPLKSGERGEEVRLQTLDGGKVQLAYTNLTSTYLLFILSTTCPHCEKTLASWNELALTAQRGSCSVVGISLRSTEETRIYAESKHVDFYLTSADTDFIQKYRIVGVPETILLNGDGVVQRTWLGELTADQTNGIKNLIGAARAPVN